MAELVVQTQIGQVGAGFYTVRVQLIDAAGTIVDQADSAPVEIAATEPMVADVHVPQVHLRHQGGGKVGRPGGGGGMKGGPAPAL